MKDDEFEEISIDEEEKPANNPVTDENMDSDEGSDTEGKTTETTDQHVPTQSTEQKHSQNSNSEVKDGGIHAEIERLEKKIEQTNKRTEEIESLLEDYQRRNKHEHEELREYAIEEFAREILQIKDNLQTAIEMEDLEEGTEQRLGAIVKKFDGLYTSGQIDRIDPNTGDGFDDNLHRMVDKKPSDNLEKNQIVDILEPGYVISDRVIRPARVIVAE